MTEPKKPKPDADLNRIDQALADIERHRQEIQTASSAGVANLLAETEQCWRLTALEIDNVIAETERRRREMRPAWQSFAVGFTIGAVCFAAAVTFIRFLK